MNKAFTRCRHAGLDSASSRSMKGFTLIELLVVVLIIGILAAVAVPQYQKSVEKARIAAAISVLEPLRKSIDVYLLENDYPAAHNEAVSFLWTECPGSSGGPKHIESAIDVRAGLDCSCAENGMCIDGNFIYEAVCQPSVCYVSAYRGDEAYNSDGNYMLNIQRSASTNTWEYSCSYFDSFGQRACSTLQGQSGWTIEDARED